MPEHGEKHHIYVTQYVYNIIKTVSEIMDEYRLTQGREWYAIGISDRSDLDTVIDLKIPSQTVGYGSVRADKHSILEVTSELMPGQVPNASFHRHPWSTQTAYLSSIDMDLLEVMSQEMCCNLIQWVESSKPLPTLDLRIGDGTEVLVDGRSLSGETLRVSGALYKEPMTRVYAFVNDSDTGGFYGQALVKTYSILSGKEENSWLEELEIKILPDDTPVDEEQIVKTIVKRFRVNYYWPVRMDSEEGYNDCNDGCSCDRENSEQQDATMISNAPQTHEIIGCLESMSNRIEQLISRTERIQRNYESLLGSLYKPF